VIYSLRVGKNLKILFIHEEPSLRSFIQRILEPAGYEVIHARSFNEGYSKAIEYKPQIVIADNILSSKPGILLCQEIQMTEGLEATEFLLLNDYDGESKDTYGIRLKGVIKKPHLLPELRNYFPKINQKISQATPAQ
jgi:DNA-binding response OmpR family regulator